MQSLKNKFLNTSWWMAILLVVVLLFAGCGNLMGSTTVKSTVNTVKQTLAPTAPRNDQYPVEIKVFFIGHGDAILIRVGDEFSLIDSGDVEHRENIVQYLKDERVKSLKRVIITHAHKDHVGGFWAIAQEFPIEKLYDNGVKGDKKMHSTVEQTIQSKKIPYEVLREGMRIDFGQGVHFDVYHPNDQIYTKKGEIDHNNTSIVGKLVYNKFSMLFAADVEKEAEERLIKEYNSKLFSRILKVPHHGSTTSSTEKFLRSVKPEAAIISVEMNSEYNLPRKEVVERIKGEGIQLYRTDEQGTITVYTDGKEWVVKAER